MTDHMQAVTSGHAFKGSLIATYTEATGVGVRRSLSASLRPSLFSTTSMFARFKRILLLSFAKPVFKTRLLNVYSIVVELTILTSNRNLQLLLG